MFTFNDFHEATFAIFTPCATPDRDPDFVSDSGSRYWDCGDRVIRRADHWGWEIASCSWFLGEWHLSTQTAECRYDQFQAKFNGEDRLRFWESPEYLAMEAARRDAGQRRHYEVNHDNMAFWRFYGLDGQWLDLAKWAVANSLPVPAHPKSWAKRVQIALAEVA